VEDPFRTASWAEHSDTLLWQHLYRVTTQIMSTLEWNKGELLCEGNSVVAGRSADANPELLSVLWHIPELS